MSVISDLLAQAEKITIRRASTDEVVGKAREELEQARAALAAAEVLVAERSKALEAALAPRLDGDNEVEAIYGRLEEFGVERDVAEAQVEARIASVRALMGIPSAQEAPAAAVELPKEAESAPARRGRGRPASQPVVTEPAAEAVVEEAVVEEVVVAEVDRQGEVIIPEEEAGPVIDAEDPGVSEDDGGPDAEYDSTEQGEDLNASEEDDGSDESDVVAEEADVTVEAEVTEADPQPVIQMAVNEPAPAAEAASAPVGELGVSPASRRRSGELPAFLR